MLSRILVVAMILLATAFAVTVSRAAPIAPVAPVAPVDIVQVHGCHRSCETGPYGWHRHGAACVRIACVPRAPYPGRCWVDAYGIRHCRW